MLLSAWTYPTELQNMLPTSSLAPPRHGPSINAAHELGTKMTYSMAVFINYCLLRLHLPVGSKEICLIMAIDAESHLIQKPRALCAPHSLTSPELFIKGFAALTDFLCIAKRNAPNWLMMTKFSYHHIAKYHALLQNLWLPYTANSYWLQHTSYPL